ncbi:hypothetical protein BZB76_4179 [Actinomadura pelletieri DSM 43383]|uniref:Uncharacterized protein n=1 Tax=Actinomadura pelletieri DSM 43383 TaxID=1120940 RepID=A0A495QLU3_9ACTN|nr:hypothetical protein [Actinomadura pelletieri]RKS73486.1 hypothetical protein BZB76_4179 [Actinomadura pelletieri DSM 43383]
MSRTSPHRTPHGRHGASGPTLRPALLCAAALVLATGTACTAAQQREGRPPPPAESSGWTATVYYTAVESFHHGPRRPVRGCPRLDCHRGRDHLGSYPSDFVQAVHDEGTGRITSGPHRGRYLNWSYDVGYWLDSAPRDTAGRALRPWRSAAADPSVLPPGHRFTITRCGHDDDGGAIDDALCARFRTTRWTIVDEFTPGLGGTRHIDLYIGEETGPGFTDTALYTTLHDASLRPG